MKRADALERIVGDLDDALCVVYLGYASREVHDRADRPGNFYMYASMGMATSTALGVALETDRRVVGIEGDGSLLMNLGTLATLARYGPDNLSLVLVDNGTYAATGDQPTRAQDVDLEEVIEAAGLPVRVARSREEVDEHRGWLMDPGCRFLVLKCDPGNEELPFIDMEPVEVKERFVAALR